MLFHAMLLNNSANLLRPKSFLISKGVNIFTEIILGCRAKVHQDTPHACAFRIERHRSSQYCITE